MSDQLTPKAQVLVVEDDQGVRESLAVVMQVQGYGVTAVETGEEALTHVGSAGPDLIGLDVNLPGIDGWETADKISGLDAGADDYLPKPFALDELLARVRALLRAFNRDAPDAPADGLLRLADLWIDREARRVGRGDVEVDLTKLEFDLLVLLVENADRVLERNDIHLGVWGYDEDTSSNTLEVFISALRRKLEVDDLPRLIHTKRGVGYVARLTT